MSINHADLRKKSFRKSIPYDNELKEIVDGYDSHKFIANSISQLAFLHLVDYVLEFSKDWFKKDVGEIKFLDWGSGKGHITYLLKKSGANVKSCDVLSDAHDSTFGQETPIIKKNNINVIPLEHEFVLPFKDESFDVIISFGVLEHVPKDLESLIEINRVLVNKGLLFCFYLPYTYSWTQKIAHMKGDNYHDRLYNKKVVQDLLNKSSLDMLDFWYRAILPKNTINYPAYKMFERFDNFLCNTPIKHIATNVEFLAVKKV